MERGDSNLSPPQARLEGGLRAHGQLKSGSTDKPLVSIVIPVYNGARHLEQAINSVTSQTYDNIECIIIDGGSTDGSLEIVKKYENQIDFWLSERDRGISDAFNKGTRLANGDLIGIIGVDDWYEPNAVELIVQKYLSTRDIKPGSYIVLHGSMRSWIDDKQIKTYSPLPIKDITWTMPLWHPTAFTTKHAYNTFSYSLNYKIAMDYDLMSRIFASGSATFISLDSTIVNIRQGGASHKNAMQGFLEVMRASQVNLGVNKHFAFIRFSYRVLLYWAISIKNRFCR